MGAVRRQLPGLIANVSDRKGQCMLFHSHVRCFGQLSLRSSVDKGVLAISDEAIEYCEHLPPAVVLLRIGAFASTPVRSPKWGFDIKFLEFMSKQFSFGTPDVTAWCNATSSFLSSQGIEKVPSPVRPIASVLGAVVTFSAECLAPSDSVSAIAL